MGAYIGVNGKAKKIQKGYIGVPTRIPIYETTGEKVTITVDNISKYFTVTNSTYYFKGNSGTWTSNNKAVNSSTAQTILTLKSDGKVSFNYSCSSESNYDKLTITMTIGGTTTTRVNAVSGVKSGSLSYDMSAGDSITFKYVKDSSASSNSDICTFSNLVHDTTQEVLAGYEEKELAKRIRKAYVGVGGKAKLVHICNVLKYYRFGLVDKMINSISYGTYGSGSGKLNGNYALFMGGGTTPNGQHNNIDTFDKDLVHSTSKMITSRMFFSTDNFVNKVLVYGGMESTNSSDPGNCESIDENLTATSITAIYSGGNRSNVSGHNKNYSIVAGGGWQGVTSIRAYNSNLTQSTPASLSNAVRDHFGGQSDEYVLFAGGIIGHLEPTTRTSAAQAYDSNLTKTTISSLSKAKYNNGGGQNNVTIGKYMLMIGGYVTAESTQLNSIDCYDSETLTKVTAPNMLYARNTAFGCAELDGKIIIGGGCSNVEGDILCDVYDENLTHEIAEQTNRNGESVYAIPVGNYVLFGGTKTKNGCVYKLKEA